MQFQLEMKKPLVLILGSVQGGEAPLLSRSVFAPMLFAGRVSESDGLLLIRKDALRDPTSCGRSWIGAWNCNATLVS